MSTPTTVTLWMVTLTTERTGPRGGKAKPIIDRYVVAATTREEAAKAFESDMPGYMGSASHCTITDLCCSTWRAA